VRKNETKARWVLTVALGLGEGAGSPCLRCLPAKPCMHLQRYGLLVGQPTAFAHRLRWTIFPGDGHIFSFSESPHNASWASPPPSPKTMPVGPFVVAARPASQLAPDHSVILNEFQGPGGVRAPLGSWPDTRSPRGFGPFGGRFFFLLFFVPPSQAKPFNLAALAPLPPPPPLSCLSFAPYRSGH
jgi:hypothetical protein